MHTVMTMDAYVTLGGETMPSARATADSTDALVGLNWIADRWGVSRSTALRALERHGKGPVFLTGSVRGVRRYSLGDVIAVEEAGRADGRNLSA